MNGFAALDIHPYRRYVVDIGGRRSSRCRLHINFALFLHSLDFTQNLGVTLVDPTIPFIRAVHVNFFDQRSNMLVFLKPLAGISRLPFVIGRRRHRQAAAGFPNGTKIVSRTDTNSFVLPFQMKLSQRFPLSSSSTFFRSSHSSFSRWFSCSSSAIRFSSSSSLERGV